MDILRYSAFTTGTGGGNPAGVVLDASELNGAEMLSIAAEVGYSETAFVVAGEDSHRVRYFSPAAEVDFCGHATIATAVALAENGVGAGDLVFRTNVGEIAVSVTASAQDDSGYSATLTTVPPVVAGPQDLLDLLGILGWDLSDLDPDLPVGVAFAGLWHPVIWAGTRERLADLDYDFEALRQMMLENDWGTVSLLFRESPDLIHSRNAFAVGGVVEDPATGAAAGALGGFLREHKLLPPDGYVTVLQGEDMDMPCLIEIDARGSDRDGVRISGAASRIGHGYV